MGNPAMSEKKWPRFAAGVVGSMPRPQFLRDLLDPRAEGTVPQDLYEKRLDAATQYVIALQEAAGLDLISDGEWRRRSYIGVIAEVVHGFDAYVVDDALGTARPFHVVVAPLAPRRPGRIAEEARFLVQHTDRLTKVCLPSPYLLGRRNEVVAGVRGVTIAVHLCRGNAGRLGWKGAGGYETLVPAMRRLAVQQYVLEYAIPVAGDMAVLRALPEDRLIGLGCVDVRGEQIDTVETIISRVEEARKYVDDSRLSLNPDC